MLSKAFRDFRAKAEADGRWDAEGETVLTEIGLESSASALCIPSKAHVPCGLCLRTTRKCLWTDVEAEIGLPPSIDDFDDTPKVRLSTPRPWMGIDEASPRPAYREFHAERIEKLTASSLIETSTLVQSS